MISPSTEPVMNYYQSSPPFSSVGRCNGGEAYYLGHTFTPAACWDACSELAASPNTPMDALVAIDWTHQHGDCSCRDACFCREDAGDQNITLLIARELPTMEWPSGLPTPEPKDQWAPSLYPNDDGEIIFYFLEGGCLDCATAFIYQRQDDEW